MPQEQQNENTASATALVADAPKSRGKAGRFFRSLRRDVGSWLLILPFLFFLVVIVLVPTVRGLTWSFYKMQGYNVGEYIGLANYRVVLSNTEFLKTLGNTIEYVLWSLLIGFWPPILVAILLNEMRGGRSFFRISVYFPCMVPAIAVSMLWYYLMFPNETGLFNMLLSWMGFESFEWLQNSKFTIPLIVLSCSWRSMGSSMLVYLACLQSVNTDLYEAATIDKAGLWARTWHITLPHLSGIILLNFVRHIIGIFQIMEQPLSMTGGGPNGASMSLGLLGYKYAFQTYKVGNSLALNVIMFLMLITLSIFYFLMKNKVEQDA